MKQTTNLGLNLPEGPDNYNVKDYNDNFEIIDEKLKYLSDNISGAVEELTVTENGTYIADPGTTYNPVHVQVTPKLEDITITQNGEYQASEGFEGLGKVTANVGEPDEKVVVDFDFTQQEYDLVRSINPESLEPRNKALLNPYLYNASYNSTNGYVSWSNYYGNIQPRFFIEPFKNYEIDIDFGEVGNDYQSASDREIFSIGDQMKLYWNTQGYFTRENSSGYERWTDLNTRDYLTNHKLKVNINWGLNSANEPTCYVNLIFDDLNGGTITKFFGNWDGVGSPYLVIGRRTSDNGLYPVQIKKIKITEKKWTLQAAMMSFNPTESRNENGEKPATEITKEPEEKETEETKEVELLKNEKLEEEQKSATE